MKNRNYLVEACVEGLNQAIRAEKQGADRIELCARLDLDGVTPEVEMIKAVFQNCKIPIRVIIRPREGGFVYSVSELDQMKESIRVCKDIGVEGVVFGMTTKENTLDISAIDALTRIATPLKVTIHKAIDTVSDPLNELGRLMRIGGIDAILTSGKSPTWEEGQELIKELIKKAANQIQIIACGKVTDENIMTVHGRIQSSAYHGKRIVGEL
ncbi:copper homeostasis protein CutC [Flavivirga spongiicola]|uniref:Copper homeostasis protein cutC homolog n=1 Tax=Flavivirga spongiicola TaxID=421621 RepID=A0ABU7XTB9_9FLAO|nr:copper homeostasis protein CutC [Flavivirga sp. MEBiC05379]MDO5979028.1 copper homeostasis protein CutC [Flavivirga sp. MEBiC05379]